MTPEQFTRLLERKASEIGNYTNNYFPSQAGNIAIRFVNGNFRAQGWQGASFNRWEKSKKKRGSTLIDKGHLRSSTYYITQPGAAILRNTLPYAKIHNEGGTINTTAAIRDHSRGPYTRKQGGKVSVVRKHNVKSHMRRMNISIPQRQFAPTANSQSPVLNNAVMRQVRRELSRILNIKF